MYRLYEFHESGNCYKVRLVFSNLGIPLVPVQVNIPEGESRTPEFLKKNPAGQVPVLEFPDGNLLPESHAILWYMAWDTPLLPDERWLQSQILRWLCFEQYKLEPKIAVARYLLKSKGMTPGELGPRLKELQKGGHFALAILDQALKGREFLVGKRYTIADIGLFGYTHVALEGAISLDRYPNIRRWLENVQSRPGYISIEA